jgi:DNA-binding IclR family transcriptional regulator
VNREAQQEAGQHSNRSVNRALQLLRRVALVPSGATASELATSVGLSRPTAFRLLTTLEENGMLDRINGRYVLGGEVARLGDLADPMAGVQHRVTPLVQDTAEAVGETITYSVRRSTSLIDVVVQANPHRVGLSVTSMVGRRWPLHASSTGKLVLAEVSAEQLDELLPSQLQRLASRTITSRKGLAKELNLVRERQFAIIDDELEDGIVSGAVPVRDDAGQLVGTVAVVGPKHRFSHGTCLEAMSHLTSVADQVARTLGLRPSF